MLPSWIHTCLPKKAILSPSFFFLPNFQGCDESTHHLGVDSPWIIGVGVQDFTRWIREFGSCWYNAIVLSLTLCQCGSDQEKVILHFLIHTLYHVIHPLEKMYSRLFLARSFNYKYTWALFYIHSISSPFLSGNESYKWTIFGCIFTQNFSTKAIFGYCKIYSTFWVFEVKLFIIWLTSLSIPIFLNFNILGYHWTLQ